MDIKIPKKFLSYSDEQLSRHLILKYFNSLGQFGNMGILQDEVTSAINRARKRKICERCCGTGNELFSMYRTCSEIRCDGKGYLE